MQISGPSGEDGSMYEIANGVLGDAAVAQDLLSAAIEGDDAVEDAGMGGGIELNEEFLHG